MPPPPPPPRTTTTTRGQGAFSKLNAHSTWSSVKCLSTSGSSNTLWMWMQPCHYLKPPWLVFPIWQSFKSGTKSRCTALVTQQVYRHSHTFGFPLLSRFFNPLGILFPVTIPFKMFFQQLCEARVGWDDLLTGNQLKGMDSTICCASRSWVPGDSSVLSQWPLSPQLR